jgi:hypothetical protein
MRQLAVAALLALFVAACSGIDAYEGERSLNRRQIPPGAGLFTGQSGQWTIMRRELPGPGQEQAGDDASSERTRQP